ncbi:MAG: pilus assembly protein N-terminal domain-containing protein [Planctomycetota bacterium]
MSASNVSAQQSNLPIPVLNQAAPVVTASTVAGDNKDTNETKSIGDAVSAAAVSKPRADTDRYGVPIPMTAAPSPSDKTEKSLAGSLIDFDFDEPSPLQSEGPKIDIPAPASVPAKPLPQAIQPAALPPMPDLSDSNPGSGKATKIADKPAEQKNTSATQASRGPELVKRDQPIRLQAPAEQTRLTTPLRLQPTAPLVIELQSEPKTASESAATSFSLSDEESSMSTSAVSFDPAVLSNSRPIQRVSIPLGQPDNPVPSSVQRPSVVQSHFSDNESGKGELRPVRTPEIARPESSAKAEMTASATTAEISKPVPLARVSKSKLSLQSVPGKETQPSKSSQAAPNTHAGLPVENGKAITLNCKEATQLSITSNIVEHSVENPEICQVVKVGNNELSIIGLKPGQTRIAFVKANSSGQNEITIRPITVQAKSTLDSRGKLASDLATTVAQMFGTKQVQIRPYEDGLIVEGYAATEKEARKILSFIRKTALVPVEDRLKAHYKY